MGIKYRDGRPYYYESVREGGRVVSRYIGSGALALGAAVIDRKRREDEAARREAWWADVARMKAEDDRLGLLSDRVEQVARRVMEAAGYHLHQRGEWRRRRMAKAKQTAPESTEVVVPTDREGRVAVFKRAQQGDKDVLPVLRAMYDEKPSLVEIFGDMGAQVETALVNSHTGKDLATREGMERKIKALREELGGPRPTAIERLLADRVVLCWIRLHQAELADATAESRTLTLADFHRRRVDSMHRRYLSALKALATVRKLALPVLQLNVAENQLVQVGV